MAKTYKQKIYDDLNTLVDLYPNAKASDMIWALEAFAEGIWRALPPPKKGRKCIERTKRYRLA